METDKIFVSNSGAGMEKALKETERFAQYEKLSHKAGIHVRLLAEEMLGMIRAVAEPSQSVFWIDGNAREVRLHLTSRAEMDIDKRDELMSVSTSGIISPRSVSWARSGRWSRSVFSIMMISERRKRKAASPCWTMEQWAGRIR